MAAAAAGCASGATRAEAPVAAPPARLLSRPRRIFKAVDLPREGTQTWFVWLIAEADTQALADAESRECAYLSDGKVIRRERYSAAALDILRFQVGSAPVTRPGGQSPAYRLYGLRLICREQAAANVNHMQCVLHLRDGGSISADIPLHDTYEQQAALIFPFRGPGLISQGGGANGGHRNISGLFALDALGLAPNYGPQVSSGSDANEDYAGFGRPLLAPAAGTVVVARGDRPDQPKTGEVNEQFLLAENPEGDPGNHVVIDHGNGEFSMIAHLQAGSLSVGVGDRVTQAQQIGRLGNSGNSYGPHVHYQLQDGPNRDAATGLPCTFTNISVDRLERGVFFTAR